MLLFNMCEGPKKIWHHFGLFLSLFLAFHLKFLQLCKKPPSYISGTHQSLFPLVNNGQNWFQKLCTFFRPYWSFRGSVTSQYVWCSSHMMPLPGQGRARWRCSQFMTTLKAFAKLEDRQHAATIIYVCWNLFWRHFRPEPPGPTEPPAITLNHRAMSETVGCHLGLGRLFLPVR